MNKPLKLLLSLIERLTKGNPILKVIIYVILNGLARSLSSGTNAALIYDTLKEEGHERQFKKVIGKYF